MLELRTDFSRRILLQLLLASIFVIGVVWMNWAFIDQFYFRDQFTHAGIVINLGIVALFLIGMVRIVDVLLRVAKEERALLKFVQYFEKGLLKNIDSIDQDSLIYRRHEAVTRLARQGIPIDQSALAASLVALESTRSTTPRYVNSILILLGVFGTIVALSIALAGATGLLQSGQELSNVTLIVHGMETALSTTLTAIVCYVFFAYFYFRMNDAQTQLVGNIEQVTAILLLPKRAQDPEGLIQSIGILVDELRRVAAAMDRAQGGYVEAGLALNSSIAALEGRMGQMSKDVVLIQHYLRDGFRLPEGRAQ